MNALTGWERGFGWLLQTTWQAAVIAVIILLAQFLLRNRLSPAWRHGLWFLLVARLLMPVTPGSAVSVFNLAKWAPRQVRPAPAEAPPAEKPGASALATVPRLAGAEVPPAVAPPGPGIQTSQPVPAMALPAETPPPSAPPTPRPMNWMRVAALVWFAGVSLLTLWFVGLECRFRRRLGRQASAPDESLNRLVDECARSLNLKERVQVRETAEVDSPAVHGLWRKRLLLPEGLRGQLSVDELRHVLRHELAHLKRRDPELNWLLVVLQILHWFNPVLWYAFARMRADRELATDELALVHTGQRDRISYGETILKVLEGMDQHRVLPGLVGIGESKARMKERIRAIARGGTVPRWKWAAGAVAVVIAGVALTNASDEKPNQQINLLERYPTSLTAGDAVPGRARPWQFTKADIFRLSGFTFAVGKQLRVETGPAELGIGHCADGAVWAVLIPAGDGKLTSTAATNQESITNVWLRFHPAQINRLFPPETVTGAGSADLEDRMRAIADAKFHSSWHAGNSALIPEPKDLTVDLDTTNGPRRFFAVDTAAQKAEYIAAFANRRAPAPAAAYEPELDTNCARVISVAPPAGARDVAPVENLRIGFDRPMNPYCVKLEWLAGGFQLNGSIQVSADRKEFIIPVRMTPGREQKLVVNRDNEREMWLAAGRPPARKPPGLSRNGFLDADAVAANEFRWSFSTKAVAENSGGSKPRVVSASPVSGATTPILTFIELTFDRPMQSPEAMLPYLKPGRPFGGPALIPDFEYDAAAHRITFAALLPPEDDARLTIRGLYGADGAGCDPVVLHYQTGTDSLDSRYVEQARTSAKNAALEKLLTSMKEARARVTSGEETVQTIRLGLSTNSFNTLEAQTATFKWQGPDQVYADITGPMMMARSFILGRDGENCWLYSEDQDGKKRLEETPAAKTAAAVLLLDPFELAKRPVAEALAERNLVLAGDAKLDGRACYRLETWEVNQDFANATKTQWWIEEATFLPRQIVQYYPNGSSITRFDYRNLNQPLPQSAFQPPVAPGGDAHPLLFEQPPGPDEQRYFRVSDGSNGRMSGRIGWNGPNGSTSSGLN